MNRNDRSSRAIGPSSAAQTRLTRNTGDSQGFGATLNGYARLRTTYSDNVVAKIDLCDTRYLLAFKVISPVHSHGAGKADSSPVFAPLSVIEPWYVGYDDHTVIGPPAGQERPVDVGEIIVINI